MGRPTDFSASQRHSTSNPICEGAKQLALHSCLLQISLSLEHLDENKFGLRKAIFRAALSGLLFCQQPLFCSHLPQPTREAMLVYCHQATSGAELPSDFLISPVALQT